MEAVDSYCASEPTCNDDNHGPYARCMQTHKRYSFSDLQPWNFEGRQLVVTVDGYIRHERHM